MGFMCLSAPFPTSNTLIMELSGEDKQESYALTPGSVIIQPVVFFSFLKVDTDSDGFRLKLPEADNWCQNPI